MKSLKADGYETCLPFFVNGGQATVQARQNLFQSSVELTFLQIM